MKLLKDHSKNYLPNTISKREDKKGVNIAWSHSLFFQIGLIVSLIAVFLAIESSIRYVEKAEVSEVDYYLEEPYVLTDFVIDIPEKVKIPQITEIKRPEAVKPKQVSTLIEIIPDNYTIVDTPVAAVDIPVISKTPADRKTEIPVDYGTKNMLNVEFVPVFPGCESLISNTEKIACMSERISKFIRTKFRGDRFSGLNSGEKQRIDVQFKIDRFGDITDVVARAGNSQLEDEGIRVVSGLPKMIPGKQGNTSVDVVYSVPIIFIVE
jgi:protein TonB